MADWDRRFLDLAYYLSAWSKDKSTKIACVIADEAHVIRSIGYNGLPRGCNDDLPERQERPLKYKWFEHGERNAIYNAARIGVSLKGCTIYLLSLACSDCARAIIQAGITRVVTTPPEYDNPRWGEELKISMQMFNEVGIPVTIVEDFSQIVNPK